MIHWVLEFQPVGARGFVTASQEEAEQLCAAQEYYPASFRLTQIRKGVVTLTMMKADKETRVCRGDLIRLLRTLYPHHITDLYYERQIGRLGPFATRVTSGPLNGMFHVDVVAAVAGSDGDY